MAATLNYGRDSRQCACFVLDKKLGKYVKKIGLLLFPTILMFIRIGWWAGGGARLRLTIDWFAYGARTVLDAVIYALIYSAHKWCTRTKVPHGFAIAENTYNK
jgi:hypothetical protein